MPGPLIHDEQPQSGGRAVLAKVMLAGGAGAIFGLIFLIQRAMSEPPYAPGSVWMAVLLRGLTFVVPLWLGAAIMTQPMTFHVAPGETLLQRACYAQSLHRTGWMLLPVWPGLLFGAFLWVRGVSEPLAVGQPMSWRWMLGVYTLTMVGAFYHMGILFSVTETRCDGEGIRCGLLHFIPWPDVLRVETNGRREYRIYHVERADVPMRLIATRDEATDEEFHEHLTAHRIKLVGGRVGGAERIVGLYWATAIGLAGGGYILFANRLVGDAWLFVELTLAGMAACLVLERARGIQHMGRVRKTTAHPPAVEQRTEARGQEHDQWSDA
jgi:hypothetical protein